MLGRVICGDDCLAQIFKNHLPTESFRYQIKAKDYTEGIEWGKICAFKVFDTKNFYTYRNNGLFNTIIRLKKKDIQFLLKNKLISTRKEFRKFKENTALAVIKNIPHDFLLNLNDIQIAEFLAGTFDSDGTIRSSTPEMYISLDSQLQTRNEPLAYEQIKFFKVLSKMGKLPKLLKIEIYYPKKDKEKAMKFLTIINKLFPKVKMKEDNNSKGTKIYIFFSCSFQNELNRKNWNFWFKKVVPRLQRIDKRNKFLKLYKKNLKFLKIRKISLKDSLSIGKKLANKIDSRGIVIHKRPNFPQCEIRIKFKYLKDAYELKRKIVEFLNCKSNYFKKGSHWFVSFYVSSKNYLKVSKFIIPFLKNGGKKKKLMKFLKRFQ